jgi:hypothetical protein
MVHRPIAFLALLALAFQTASAFLTPLSIGQLPILELRACLSGISRSAHRLCSVSGPLFPNKVCADTCIGTKKRTHAHATRAYPPPRTHTHTHTHTRNYTNTHATTRTTHSRHRVSGSTQQPTCHFCARPIATNECVSCPLHDFVYVNPFS